MSELQLWKGNLYLKTFKRSTFTCRELMFHIKELTTLIIYESHKIELEVLEGVLPKFIH